MLGKIYRYLADDHRRFDALLGARMERFSPRGTKATRRRTASRRAQTAPRSRRLGCAAGPIADGAGGCGDSRDFQGS